MKKYEKPEVIITKFMVEDILTASSVNIDGGSTNFPDSWINTNIDGESVNFPEQWSL